MQPNQNQNNAPQHNNDPYAAGNSTPPQAQFSPPPYGQPLPPTPQLQPSDQLPPPARPLPTLQDYSAYERHAAQFAGGVPQRRGKSVLRGILLTVFALLLLGGISAGGYFAYKAVDKSPQERLDAAIEKRLDTKLIQQDYAIEKPYQQLKVRVTSSSVSDFSDSANPKTKGRYLLEMLQDDGTAAVRIESDFLMPNKDDTYVRYISAPTASLGIPDEAINRWVKLDTEYVKTILDPVSVSSGMNTPEGEIVTGQFGGRLRNEILNRIRNDQIYTVTASADERLNGQDVIKYSVNLRNDKVAELNRYIAGQLKLPENNGENRYQSKKFTAWIDKVADRIAQIYTEVDDTKITVKYRYPGGDSDAGVPNDYINGSTLFDR